MSGVETGERAIAALAPFVLQELLVAGRHPNTTTRVDGFGPGVAGQIREAPAEAPLQLRRQRIVVGFPEPGHLEHAPKFGPWRASLDAARRAGIGCVEIMPLFEPAGHRPEVAHF